MELVHRFKKSKIAYGNMGKLTPIAENLLQR